MIHELVVEAPPARLDGWQLVAAPYPGLHGVTPVEPGWPFRFSSKYGTRLYAVPAGEELPSGFEPAWAEGRPVGDFPVHEVSSVPVFHPLQRVRTSLALVELSAEGIVLEVVGEEREPRLQTVVLMFGMFLVPVLLALLWLWRLRARRLSMDRRGR